MQLPPLLARRQSDGPAIPDIVGQHVEEAAFLWILREGALNSPRYDLDALIALEDRLQAHLVGASLAPALSEPLCLAGLEGGDASSMFAACALGMLTARESLLAAAGEALDGQPLLLAGFIGAGDWVGPPLVERSLHMLPPAQGADVERMRAHSYLNARMDPGPLLADWVASEDPALRALGARACGVLARSDLAPLLAEREADSDAERFACRWSRVLLGEPSQSLYAYLEEPGEFTHDALALALRRLPLGEANQWVRSLERAGEVRCAVLGAVATGDSVHVPWLLELMDDPALARAVAAAFAWITGVTAHDGVYADGPPEEAPASPSDDPDDPLVSLELDGELPWPKVDALRRWWGLHGTRLVPGQRYMHGQVATAQVALKGLGSWMLHERSAAAAELARLAPKEILFPVRTRGRQQRSMLSNISVGST